MNAWVGNLKGAVLNLDFDTDINRANAAAMGYDRIDRFLVRVLWWHFGALALMVLTNAVFKLALYFASPIAWRVISPIEGLGALVMALAAAWIPTELRGKLRNHYAYRLVMSTALTVFSYLFVFISGGSIELHFHFFMVMALLVIYADWRLGWLVLVLTSLHHLILNYVQPQWVYSYGRNDLSIIAHGLPVLVTAIFTTRLCETHRHSVEALSQTSAALQQDILARQKAEAALRQAHDRLEARVEERTAELLAANKALQAGIVERQAAHETLRQAQEKLAAQHEEIRATTQQLWQAAKLATMGELVAGIAHELNNPLATISLRMESMLSQMPEDDARRRPLEVVQQESERMAALVANLLQLGRRGQPQMSTLNVGDELAQALELMHYHFTQRQIDLKPDFEAEVPRVMADRHQLRQVFLNLLTNAADAMPQGGRLEVRVRGGGPAKPDTVVVEVADSGAGISPENLARVWEPFFTTKAEGRGTGLGLSICRHILQEHGATIELESQVGQGTTARVRLPVRPPEDSTHSARLKAEGHGA